MSRITAFVRLSIVLVTIFCTLRDIEGKTPVRIVGGDAAATGEFPYLVALMKRGFHKCGGSIIDKRHVITAAHCLNGVSSDSPKDLSVLTGTNHLRTDVGKSYAIKSVTVHPEYSNESKDAWKNDIAILTLTKNIVFNDVTKPLILPEEDTPENLTCFASGWGDMSYPRGVAPVNLRKTVMTTMSNKDCQSNYNTVQFSESHLCAYQRFGVGLCSGDSGGPLVYDNILVGIASFVIPCGVGKPDVFTRVYTYRNFIQETIKNT